VTELAILVSIEFVASFGSWVPISVCAFLGGFLSYESRSVARLRTLLQDLRGC